MGSFPFNRTISATTGRFIPGQVTAAVDNPTQTVVIGAPTNPLGSILIITDDPSNPRGSNVPQLIAVQDHNNAPIWSIPPAGGPRAFGDYFSCWTGTSTASVTLTPWDAFQTVGNGVGAFTGPSIYAGVGAPLPASTITKLGTFTQVANVGDIYFRQDTSAIYWCTVAGTGGSRGGSWSPNLNVPGNINATFGSFDASLTGTGYKTAEGANAKQGLTAALVGGTLLVANTSITATSRLLLTRQAGGTNPGAAYESARVAGTSFTVTSTNAADTGQVAFEIFEVG